MALFIWLWYSVRVFAGCPEAFCSSEWVGDMQIGNGECNSSCMRSDCQFDSAGVVEDSDCWEECSALGCNTELLGNGQCDRPVSYTHLTLPTKRIV